MRVDDPLGDRQAYPEALRFRRDEWCEHLADDFRRQTRPRLSDTETSTLAALDRTSYRDATPRRRRLSQRVHGVSYQVEADLLRGAPDRRR